MSEKMAEESQARCPVCGRDTFPSGIVAYRSDLCFRQTMPRDNTCWKLGFERVSAERDTASEALRKAVRDLTAALAEAAALRGVVQALLLFHSGSPWDAAKSFEWSNLTGDSTATTKTLCDFARKALAPPVGGQGKGEQHG